MGQCTYCVLSGLGSHLHPFKNSLVLGYTLSIQSQSGNNNRFSTYTSGPSSQSQREASLGHSLALRRRASAYGQQSPKQAYRALVTFHRLDVKVMYPVGIGSPSKEKNLKFLRELH